MKRRYWLVLIAVLALLAVTTPWVAAAPPYYVRGDFNGWATTDQMAETSPGSSIYTAAVVIGTAGRHQWKAANDDWSEGWPGSGNSWFYTATDDQTVNFTLDQNTYSDGWWPQTNIIATNATPPTAWTAVGDWQGWDNANAATAMADAGGGIYRLLYTVPTAGAHEYKAVNTGSWDAVGADGIGVNAATVAFTTTSADQPVRFEVDPAAGRVRVEVLDELVINELDADQVGTDAAEFIELYDGGQGDLPLDGLVLVLFNGNGDVSYGAYDLDGYATSAGGYFVLCGDAANVPNCDLDVTPDTNLIQNGADAAALYFGDAADFPNNTPVTSTNLIDAIVYDTSDADDPELLAMLLNPGQPQVDENSAGDGVLVSNQRCPNGAGGQRNTDTYIQAPPTAGLENACQPDVTIDKVGPATVSPGSYLTYTVSYGNIGIGDAAGVVITDALPGDVSYVADGSGLPCPACLPAATGTLTWYVGTLAPSASGSFTLTVLVSDTPASAILTNTVDITGSNEAVIDNNTASVETLVVTADVAVSKTGPADPLRPGDTISYTVSYDLTGGGSAEDVELTDLFPAGFGYLAYSAPPALNCDELLSGPSDVIGLVCTATELVDPGDIVVTGTVPAAPDYVITNTVEITASNDENAGNNYVEYVNKLVVPIHEVQYVPDPVANDASPFDNEFVWIEGVVTVSSDDLGGTRYFIEEPGGGPWSGLYVYTGGDRPPVQEGDWVLAYGMVDEYYNLTEFDIRNSRGGQQQILSSTNPLPLPEILDTGEYRTASPATAEPYEGVFIEFQGATVTNDNLGYGEWQIDDGTGSTRVDDMSTSMTYVPTNGDYYIYIRGLGYYGNNDYKLEPRYDADILQPTFLECEKAGPATVLPGALFTYTLTTNNETGIALTDLVITDALPSVVTIAAISDGGMDMGGNVVSWTVPSLAAGTFITRTVAVTAPATSAVVLINEDYHAWASNWPTPTVGSAVPTLVNTPGGVVPIHTIQGSGPASPLDGLSGVAIEGVVVGDFQGSTRLRGFFVQEEDADVDADPMTSEGIFVYDSSFGVDVSVGDEVYVVGTVSEYNGLTELGSVTSVVVNGTGLTVTPATIDLPVAAVDDLEWYEGMSVSLPEVLHATESYNLGHYGEVLLADDGRVFNPTQVVSPGAEAIALQEENNRRVLVLDDGSTTSYPKPVPYLGEDDTLRLGDTLNGVSGALTYSTGSYRIEPTGVISFTRANPRTPAPAETPGSFTVASLNVLNYFNGDGQGGGFPTSRGANTLEEFIRQRTKIIAAIVAIDPDVIGLMEIENDGYDQYSAIQDLVNGLNDATAPGTYAFVDFGGPVGTDEIIQGIIYKPATATPIGSPAVLDSSVDPTFLDDYNRPALAQTFEDAVHGERFTVAVNHLKSKGSGCDAVGDPDIGDGQGNCNLTRLAAAIALTNWLASDPTGSGDPDALIIGDLNSYAMEDPMTAIKNAGYTDLQAAFVGPEAYTYVFNGQFGSLDQALANSTLAPQVAGTTIWHINSDEPPIIDYNMENKLPPDYLPYAPDAYRASDHDPIVIRLSIPVLSIAKEVEPDEAVDLGGVVTYTITLNNSGDGLAAGVMLTDELPVEVTFGGWVTQPAGASHVDGTITWAGDVAAGTPAVFVFTATVGTDPGLYGQTITNTALYSSDNAGSGSAGAAFTMATAPLVPILSIAKEVEPDEAVELGGVVTYTITLNNSGDGLAAGVMLTDELPVEVTFGGWVTQPAGASHVDGTITWAGDVASGTQVMFVFTATVGTDHDLYGQTITNTASFSSANAGSSADDAAFSIVKLFKIFLPIVARNG